MSSLRLRHTSGLPHVCVKVTYITVPFILPFLLPPVIFYPHFSSTRVVFCFPPYCQPCHLPISPLPSRVRNRVLTLGFVQICRLRGWKVVMKAKKNSLALSLTTRLASLMKPNENSIFYPCYSLPPSVAPCLCPFFSTSGASNLQINFLFMLVLVQHSWFIYRCGKFWTY